MNNDLARLRKCVDFGNGNIGLPLIYALIFIWLFQYLNPFFIIPFLVWGATMIVSGFALRGLRIWGIWFALLISISMVILGAVAAFVILQNNPWQTSIPMIIFMLYGVFEAITMINRLRHPIHISSELLIELEKQAVAINLKTLGTFNICVGTVSTAISAGVLFLASENFKTVVISIIVLLSSICLLISGIEMSRKRSREMRFSLNFNTYVLILCVAGILFAALCPHRTHNPSGIWIISGIVFIFVALVRYSIRKYQKLMYSKGDNDA